MDTMIQKMQHIPQNLPPIPPEGALWLDIAAFVALTGVAAFCTMAETALAQASRARMAALEKDGHAAAVRVNALRARGQTVEDGLRLCGVLARAAVVALAVFVAGDYSGAGGVAAAVTGAALFLFVLGDILPRAFAVPRADGVALALSRPASFVVAVFAPAALLFSCGVAGLLRLTGRAVTAPADAQEEELRGAIAMFRATTDVDDADEVLETGAMLRSILDLADVPAEDIMVHRKNMKTINADWPADKIIDTVLDGPYTRLPVWRDTPDNVMGVLHAKQLLTALRRCDGDVARLDVMQAVMEPWFIPASTSLFDQLQAFRKRREHFALLVDEYGVIQGILTLEDILEEIVGQIEDEHDKVVQGVRPQPDGSFIVDGKVTIRDINRDRDWNLPDDDYSTIAGLLLYESQRIPNVGQLFAFHDGFRFEVLRRQRNQIMAVRIIPPPADAPSTVSG